MLSTMVKSEGYMSMFKGNMPNILRVAPYTAIEFYTNDLFKKLFTSHGIF